MNKSSLLYLLHGIIWANSLLPLYSLPNTNTSIIIFLILDFVLKFSMLTVKGLTNGANLIKFTLIVKQYMTLFIL